MKFLKGLLLGVVILCTSISSIAQQDQQKLAFELLKSQLPKWGLQQRDIRDISISDWYTSYHSGISHVYFIQRYKDIEVYNALMGIHFNEDGKLVYATSRFQADLEQKVNTTQVGISPFTALRRAAESLDLPIPASPEVLTRSNTRTVFATAAGTSSQSIPAQLVYLPMPDNSLRLVWNIFIHAPNSSSAWNSFVDAVSGEILDQRDERIYCTFENLQADVCSEHSLLHSTPGKSFSALPKVLAANMVDGASYRVFPITVESPVYGDREMVQNPADPVASPFGWHDTDGRAGPEYTFTRGNNVYAYRDAIPDDGPDGPEPNGGDALIFDFPYRTGGNPDSNQEASVTQLFYMNNIMHDFSYHYGFDEAAGNYQQNNYGNGGRGTDPVLAEAQDGSDLNNANFLPSRDGDNGQMQMFLFASSPTAFRLNSPGSLQGNYPFTRAQFGPFISKTITGEVVAAVDTSSNNPTELCNAVQNTEELSGKIALIDRGGCNFELKVKLAEAAGAVACIICNNTDGLITMANDPELTDPSIPSILITQEDCRRFRTALESTSIQAVLDVPDFLDSGFDNGIVAHEYGHGISTRLTGGPDRPFCLVNDEQMGEGWSDFFTLVMFVRPGTDGRLPRGIGNFASGQGPDGIGFRRQRYSTDFTINDQTYDDIIGTLAPHSVGEIWAATLWDLYWNFVEIYGWDPDLYTGTGGNNMVIQLVMDALKLQPCNPGFIDGRDAILAADLILNDGANECLIWEVFAKRGLGWSAQQNDVRSRNDNTPGFDINPACIQELKLKKTSSPLILAGDRFTVTLEIQNDLPEAVQEVVVSDEIPEGATFVSTTVEGASSFRFENGTAIFEVGRLEAGATQTISYQLESDAALFSNRLFFDDMENGRVNWNISDLTGNDFWRLDTSRVYSGVNAWRVPNTIRVNDQALQLRNNILVEGDRPILRFYHQYDIEPGLDGAIVEISTNNGFNWKPVTPQQIFRNTYTGRVARSVFRISKQNAYWGKTDNFVASYIDLSDYLGQEVRFRFRYASDAEEGNGALITEGWYIDDIELLDMFNYESTACVTALGGHQACVENEARGTVVETGLATPVESIPENSLQVLIYPNPGNRVVNVELGGLDSESLTVDLMSIEGQLLQSRLVSRAGSRFKTQLHVEDLPAGIYLVRLQTTGDTIIRKVIVE